MASEGLQLTRAWYTYDREPVLRDVSFSLGRGETAALAGPNGSGKTTLLKLLSGALRPTHGSALIDGRDIGSMRPRTVARMVGVMAQQVDPNLPFTVTELVQMGRTPHVRFLGAPTSADSAAVERALRDTETARLSSRLFRELSGGEQQRVMLAVALAQETDFLLLDEPTVHLDLHHQHDLLELLTTLHHDRGIGIVAVMHDLNPAALYFDRLAVMAGGQLVAEGRPDEIIDGSDALGVFQAPLSIVRHPKTGVPQVLLDRR